MNTIAIPATEEKRNLADYKEACQHFDWNEIEKEFTWHKTGKLNIVYEAIDRHCETVHKNKVALYYSDAKRDEKYTFHAKMVCFYTILPVPLVNPRVYCRCITP